MIRKLRRLCDKLWYHRPVFMTLARLEDITTSATVRGINIAQQPAPAPVLDDEVAELIARISNRLGVAAPARPRLTVVR
jgi:hypothetical protein